MVTSLQTRSWQQFPLLCASVDPRITWLILSKGQKNTIQWRRQVAQYCSLTCFYKHFSRHSWHQCYVIEQTEIVLQQFNFRRVIRQGCRWINESVR